MMIDLAVMCVGVLCCLLPDPWKYLVLIFIGARTIIKDFITEIKKPAPQKHRRRKRSERDEEQPTREKKHNAEEKHGRNARKETDNAKAAGKTYGKQKTAR